MAHQLKHSKIPWPFILIFIFMVAGISIAGYNYHQNYKKNIIANKQNELIAIAKMKVDEISRWRNDRLDDAYVIQNSLTTISQINNFLNNPSAPEPRVEISNWIKSLQEYYRYSNVYVLDPNGVIWLSTDEESQKNASAHLHALAMQAAHTKEVIFSDIHRVEGSNDIHLELIIPLFRGGDKSIEVGVLVLEIDPDEFLYPLIQTWPSPSRTAETMLVRREGDKVVFLNELRHQKNTALNLSFPIEEEDLPAALAARGIVGIVEGKDYRGAPVLAAIDSVPNTLWYLIAKVDKEEIYAQVHMNAQRTSITVALLIIISGVITGLIWQRMVNKYYHRQLEAELEQQALAKRFDYLSKYANDIIMLLDENLNIIEANERAISSYGYSREELLELSIKDIRSSEAVKDIDKHLGQLKKKGGTVIETVHRRKDGTTFPVEVSLRLIEEGDKKYYQNIIRNITDRKQAEDELKESESRYRSLFEDSPIPLWEEDFSGIKKCIDKLKESGVVNLRSYFENHPEEVIKCAGMVRVIDVNRAALELFKAKDKKDFRETQQKLLIKEAYQILGDELIAISEGKTLYEGEIISHNFTGEQMQVILRWSVALPYKNTYSKVLISIIDITERKKLEEELRHLATHDSLTGLYSRSFFEEQISLLSKERDPKIGFIILDLDGLKYINDALGHQQGDILLMELAKILKNTFRPSDVIARIGGDEFAVLMRGTDKAKVKIIAKRLRNNITIYNGVLKTYQNPISVSIGYAVKNIKNMTIEQIFKEADDALFKEKIPKRDDVRRSILKVIQATMLEKDYITEEHMQRMKEIADKFGYAFNLTAEEKYQLFLLTELHDIGKVIIPDEILNKKGPLSQKEFEIIKKHSESGYRIAKATPEIAHIADLILYSHERWDGKGYPKGLKNGEIPLLSRMMHILDAYDAMTNDRSYRKAITHEQAVKELLKNASTQFDPDLVDIFIKVTSTI
ncbi:MAG: diguanylate cyclase [Actinobacteria bacterium]|nr:diguanylate cyclase [Actinomycetota bacterium]